MNAFFTRVRKEAGKILPSTLFFLVALHLLALTRALLLKGVGITLDTSISMTVTALVLGKTVLLVDMLPFINRYPDRPLAWNILWKSMLYFLVALVVHYLEQLIEFWREAGSLAAANDKFLGQIIWPHFWAIQIWLAVIVLSYCTMREMVREIGEERMLRLFFGPLPAARPR